MVLHQMLDDILNGTMEPAEVTRIATFIDGVKIDTPALNDILIAHPSPAAISRCSFRCETSFVFGPTFYMQGNRLVGYEVSG